MRISLVFLTLFQLKDLTVLHLCFTVNFYINCKYVSRVSVIYVKLSIKFTLVQRFIRYSIDSISINEIELKYYIKTKIKNIQHLSRK